MIFELESLGEVVSEKLQNKYIDVFKAQGKPNLSIKVCRDIDGQGSVVLAASPALKKDFGIKTGSRLFEISEDPRIHIVNPQMKLFIRVSAEITKLFYRFVPEKCVHTYSIDESFLDAGKEDPEEMAKAIQSSMWREFGLMCTVGIGEIHMNNQSRNKEN